MAHLQVLCTVLACVIIYFTCSSDAKAAYAFICRECTGLECDAEPEGGCRYGTSKDICTNRTVCKKGPGESCGGGLLRQDGRCGDGLTCRCGVCTGCFLERPKDCFPNDIFCHENYNGQLTAY